MKKGNICIIPARGGSKRLPGKNIKQFFGKPVISYAIQTALASELFDEVFVSTDCEEIAEVATQCGANASYLRSSENSNDFATTNDVILEVLRTFMDNGYEFERVCCLYPVAPLVTANQLSSGLKNLLCSPDAMVFPVLEYSHPIWRAIGIEDGVGKRIWKENTNERTQDLRTTYHDAGQWYWMKTEGTLTGKELQLLPVVIREEDAQDVDDLRDWRMLELKYQLKNDSTN